MKKLKILIPAILIIIAIVTKFNGIRLMSDISMSPNLYLFEPICMTDKTVERGDIVIFKTDKGLSIKRLVGMPGDYLSFKNNILYVNEEEFLRHNENDNIYYSDWEIQLGKDEYFVLGDNFDNSLDSRAYGPVNEIISVIKPIFR